MDTNPVLDQQTVIGCSMYLRHEAAHAERVHERGLMQQHVRSCRALRDAGCNGLSAGQLAERVSAGQAGEAACAGQAPGSNGQLLGALLSAGLIRRVAGYQSWAYVAAEHSQCYLPEAPAAQQAPGQGEGTAEPGSAAAADAVAPQKVPVTTQAGASQDSSEMAGKQPQLGSSSGAAPMLEGHAGMPELQDLAGAAAQAAAAHTDARKATIGAASSSTPDASNPSSGCHELSTDSESAANEATLLPWTDHQGRLNRPLWRALTQRAISLVIRHPGMHAHCFC